MVTVKCLSGGVFTHVSPTVSRFTGKQTSHPCLERLHERESGTCGTPQKASRNRRFGVLSKKWKEYLDLKQQLCMRQVRLEAALMYKG